MPQQTPPPQSPAIQAWLRKSWDELREWFDHFLDLREGMDREGASESIKQGKFMRGSNAWMLVCSIMIASLGLNLDSGAVIIGAMLISPLMNPILGLGLGVATNDRETLWQAIRHFFIAIIIALITSTLYFTLTPLKDFTPEMDARTAPTILDGLVAIFGGLAGIISVTRADKTNAIPGVAIATALMPPLCVSGYGLASGDWNIAVRSFYLFFLNSFFIATTAYVIIRLLRFPYRTYVNKKEARRSRILIALFSILIIIPGFFILRDVLRDLRSKQNVARFIEEHFKDSCLNCYLHTTNTDSTLLIMELLNKDLNGDSLTYYNNLLHTQYRQENTYILPDPDKNFSRQQMDQLAGQQTSSMDQINQRLDVIQAAQEKATETADTLALTIAKYRFDSSDFIQFSAQLQLAFPSILEVDVARSQSQTDSIFRDGVPLVAIRRKPGRSNRERNQEMDRINAYLCTALKEEAIKLIEYK